MEIVSLLLGMVEPSRELRALVPIVAFLALVDVDSFLFGVVFGGANGCCGDAEPGFGGGTTATVGWLTILRGRPRGAFFSLSIDLERLKNMEQLQFILLVLY